jgi:hypothetical protein
LEITIEVEEGITVKNTYQPKKEAYREKFRIDYLNQVYGYFRENPLHISVDGEYFIFFAINEVK